MSNNDEAVQDEHQYQGYQPASDNEFIARTNHVNRLQYDSKALALFQRRSLKLTTRKLSILAVILALIFLLLFIWQILVSTCRVSAFCHIIDASSEKTSPYRFRTFGFTLPSALVWLGLSIGSFSLLVANIQVIKLLAKPLSSSKVIYVLAIVKQASSVILLLQYIVIIIPAAIIFVVVGVAINWSTAGAFVMGSTIAILTSHIASSLSTKATSKLADAAQSQAAPPLSEMVSTAMQSAALIHLSTVAVAAVALSAVYLMYSDIRALAGFVAGSSVAVLVLRLSTSVLFDSTVTAFNLKPPFRQMIPPNVIAVVSSGLGVVNGFVADAFDSVAICVIATAITGSSLPFFHGQRFAMCVFNHLSIDHRCGPFGYPQALSYASYICRQNFLYLQYPSLSSWSSVSVFVAAPFVLTAASTVVSLVCWLVISFLPVARSQEDSQDHAPILKTFVKRVNLLSLLAACLLTISSLAVCFGLFGPSSSFQSASGFGATKSLPRMILDGSSSQCIPDPTSSNPAHVPNGAQFVNNRYRPFFVSGVQIGSVLSTATRLFFCNFLGIVAATIVALFSTYGFLHRTTNHDDLGSSAITARRLAINILVQLPVTIVLVTILVLSYELYGAYGVGFAALGYMSASAVTVVASIAGCLLTNAHSVAVATTVFNEIPKQKRKNEKNGEFELQISRMASSSAHIVCNGGALFAAVTALLAVVYQAGIWASPRDLVGSIEMPAVRLIASVDVVGITDALVLVGLLVGAIAPFLVGALFVMSVQYSSVGIYVQKRAETLTSLLSWPALVGRSVKMVIQQAGLVMVVGVFGSIAVGFGLGSRAMVGALISSTVVSYVIGTLVISGTGDANDSESGVVRVVKSGMGPTMQVAMKAWVAMGFVMSTVMEEDKVKGWIGLVMFLLFSLVIGVLGSWNHRQYSMLVEAACVHDQCETWDAPARRISPFYEEGSTMLAERVKAGSEMGETMKLFGRPEGAVNPARAQVTTGSAAARGVETEDVIVPRQLMAIAEGVNLDETRHQ